MLTEVLSTQAVTREGKKGKNHTGRSYDVVLSPRTRPPSRCSYIQYIYRDVSVYPVHTYSSRHNGKDRESTQAILGEYMQLSRSIRLKAETTATTRRTC